MLGRAMAGQTPRAAAERQRHGCRRAEAAAGLLQHVNHPSHQRKHTLDRTAHTMAGRQCGLVSGAGSGAGAARARLAFSGSGAPVDCAPPPAGSAGAGGAAVSDRRATGSRAPAVQKSVAERRRRRGEGGQSGEGGVAREGQSEGTCIQWSKAGVPGSGISMEFDAAAAVIS